MVGQAPSCKRSTGCAGAGGGLRRRDFHVHFLDLVEDSSGELVAEGNFQGQFRMLGKFLPGAFEDEGSERAQGSPVRFEDIYVEGPVADAVVVWKIEVEGFNFDSTSGFERFA